MLKRVISDSQTFLSEDSDMTYKVEQLWCSSIVPFLAQLVSGKLSDRSSKLVTLRSLQWLWSTWLDGFLVAIEGSVPGGRSVWGFSAEGRIVELFSRWGSKCSFIEIIWAGGQVICNHIVQLALLGLAPMKICSWRHLLEVLPFIQYHSNNSQCLFNFWWKKQVSWCQAISLIRWRSIE